MAFFSSFLSFLSVCFFVSVVSFPCGLCPSSFGFRFIIDELFLVPWVLFCGKRALLSKISLVFASFHVMLCYIMFLSFSRMCYSL